MTLSRGIDVSHHQGTIDWPRITRELRLDWAACKATEGRTFRDSRFAANWAGIKAAGLVRMAYHFGHPGTDATAQARFFLSVVRPVKGDVLCLDLETSDGKDQTECNAWAREFAAALRKGAPGCTLVAYLGGYSANGTGRNLSDHFDYWWYPRYATMRPVRTWPTSYAPRLAGNTTGWKAPHIWQWAASLATSEGAVDANISPLTAAQLRDGPRTPAEPAAPFRGSPATRAWQALLAFAPSRRDGVWGPATDQRSQWLATAARHKAGTLAGSRTSTIRLVQRVIRTPDDGVWGPASRAAMTAWTRRAQAFLGVTADGEWGPTTQAAYERLRSDNRI